MTKKNQFIVLAILLSGIIALLFDFLGLILLLTARGVLDSVLSRFKHDGLGLYRLLGMNIYYTLFTTFTYAALSIVSATGYMFKKIWSITLLQICIYLLMGLLCTHYVLLCLEDVFTMVDLIIISLVTVLCLILFYFGIRSIKNEKKLGSSYM